MSATPKALTLNICRRVFVVGLALVVILMITPLAAGQKFTVLYSFKGLPDDGWGPLSGVVLDSSGNIYGTTYSGGNSTACPYGCGTIFKLDSAGNETVLHSFNKTDGRDVNAGVILDDAGTLYGATRAGGDFDYGTLFKFDPSGVLTTLLSFDLTNGSDPVGGLLRDSKGTLYGTVETGNPCEGGEVFQLSSNNDFEILHCFNGDGGFRPQSSLIRDSGGNLYGTTFFGGAANEGTVFRVAKSGFTVLHSFTKGADAQIPAAGLVRDSQGNLYGTTQGSRGFMTCAQHGGCGTVFKLDASGNETVLHTFMGGVDGAAPEAGLLRDAATGNLYGTTTRGGTFNQGTVFVLGLAGQFKVLHSFTGGSGGSDPWSVLVRDAGGHLYGTTVQGGVYDKGTVFRMDP